MMHVTRFALCAVLVLGLGTVVAAQDLRLPEPVGMEGNPDARIVLDGNAAFLRGDLQAAAKAYRVALLHRPGFAVAAFNLGLVEAHAGRRMQGLADMDRGIALAGAHGMSSSFVDRLRALRRAFAAQPVAT